MKPLDQAIRDAFLEGIRRRGVAAGEVWDYVKWLRYYLDFCEKYRREALDRESLQAFLLKLASKNQSAGQQDQAARSVGLYLEMAVPRPVRRPHRPRPPFRAPHLQPRRRSRRPPAPRCGICLPPDPGPPRHRLRSTAGRARPE